MLNTLLIYNKESAVIDTDLPYGYFLRIGEYEGTSIYTLTNFSLQLSSDIKNACDPTDFYIKEFFKAMTESFPNFSSDFLLYYINSKKGLRSKLSSQLMIELREFGTLKDSHFNKPNPTNESVQDKDGIQKLLCDEELDEREHPQVRSDLTNKYTRKWIYPPNSRGSSIQASSSAKGSEYQHSLVKNKNGDHVMNPTTSGINTSLGNIPELSFEKKEEDVDIFLKFNQQKPLQNPEVEDNKVFVVNRKQQTPISEEEANLLCNEDLDLNLLSHDNGDRNPNFAGMVHPDLIGIPSDISQFDKCLKSDDSSHIKTDEGFEEFMRWGNKFNSESQNNSPPAEIKNSNGSSSFTFTKKDQNSPNRENSQTNHEESKFEELEIQE